MIDSRQEILSNIRRRQKWDFAFAFLGLMSLMFALVTLLALIVDLSITGVPRIDWAFFTNFPSRFPQKAGILSAWVGSFCIMLTTAFCAIPL
ncbi:MAG TPA: hypothetical protein VN132_00215, partial [Bdellovibrio sp.]|nr:hypothetical protein [Bdellovibrio sp.]